MKTYQYHSIIFDREVQITYNKNGLLMAFKTIDGEDIDIVNLSSGMLKNPVREADFLKMATENKLKLVEVERRVSFEMFWDAYKQKDCGVTKARQAWSKLTKAEQLGAFDFIGKQDQKIKQQNIAKPYATTYLNQKRWIQ